VSPGCSAVLIAPQASCIRNAPSRGKLTRDFLEGSWSPLAYLQQLPITDYNGYNLIVGDLGSMQLAYGSNRGEAAVHGPRLLAPGVYGLSNAVLDTPWPKVCLFAFRRNTPSAHRQTRRRIDRSLHSRMVRAAFRLNGTSRTPLSPPHLGERRCACAASMVGREPTAAADRASHDAYREGQGAEPAPSESAGATLAEAVCG
jgi:hypothetical protein